MEEPVLKASREDLTVKEQLVVLLFISLFLDLLLLDKRVGESADEPSARPQDLI